MRAANTRRAGPNADEAPVRFWPLRRANGEVAAGAASAQRGQQVLRPVSPLFMWATMATGLALDLLPWGRTPLVPDFLALALVFWNVHQPRRVGMGAAFLFGLLMDVHDGALFGEHALAYTLLSYGAIALHRRIQWFPVLSQSLFVLPLLLVAQLASAAVRLWVGGASGSWWVGLSESVVGTLLWPLVTWMLLAPQRRPISRDETRPL
jgi:rod shape-determining protein MreD